MPAPKGRPKPKNSGLKKGSKIKRTLEWEEFGRLVIEGNLPRIQQYFDNIQDPDRHYEAWLKLVNYFKPQLARVEKQDLDGKGKPTEKKPDITVFKNYINISEPKNNGDKSTT